MPQRKMTSSDFDKIKKLQARKNPASVEEITERTGWARETQRLVAKSGSWSAFRQRQAKLMRQRKEARQAARDELKSIGYQSDKTGTFLEEEKPIEASSAVTQRPSLGQRFLDWVVRLINA